MAERESQKEDSSNLNKARANARRKKEHGLREISIPAGPSITGR
jgi:hypothetical protein